MRPARSNKSKGPSLISEDAYEELVTRKHAVLAWCHLLVPEASRSELDAVTLDASCQARTASLLDAATTVRKGLTDEDYLDFLCEARQALANRVNDISVTQIRTVDDVWGEHPLTTKLANYISLFHHIVGDSLFTIVRLCFTNAVNATWYFDENGGAVSYLSDPIYTAETPATEDTPPSYTKHLYDLRSTLGRLSTGYIKELADTAASSTFKAATLDQNPIAWPTLADQLAASLHYISSFAPQKEGSAIQLQPLIPQTLVALQNAYLKDHGLTIKIRRVKMRPVEEFSAMEEIEETQDDIKCEYMLEEVRVYCGVSDKSTGRFKLVPAAKAAKPDKLRMYFDLFSYYVEDAEGDDLASSNNDEYFAAIESPQLDPVWALILPVLVAHAPYTSYAEDKSKNHDKIYKALCPAMAEQPKHSRFRCEGFSFNHDADATTTSLYEAIQLTRGLINEHDLGDTPEFNRANPKEPYQRRCTPQECAIRHILTGSINEATTEAKNLLDLRARHPDIVVNGYLARIGRGAASFHSREEAENFVQASSRERAKREYRENYPANWAFMVEAGMVN